MKKQLNKELSKFLISFIIILVILIISKKNIIFKNKINYIISDYNISFTNIKKIYNKYLGGIYFINNINKSNTNTVFNPNISYKKLKDQKNYLELKVDRNYLVPSLTEGIVIFIGNKKTYGNTIIIQTPNNINIWYGNISNTSLKLYDSINKGEYIGEVNGNILYIAYSKGKNMLKAIKIFENSTKLTNY